MAEPGVSRATAGKAVLDMFLLLGQVFARTRARGASLGDLAVQEQVTGAAYFTPPISRVTGRLISNSTSPTTQPYTTMLK